MAVMTFSRQGQWLGLQRRPCSSADRHRYRFFSFTAVPKPQNISRATASVVDQKHFCTDLRIRTSDQWIRILLFLSLTCKTPTKNFFSAYYFLKVRKKSQNSRNQGFSHNFCLIIEESESGHLTNGSGHITLSTAKALHVPPADPY